MQHWWGLVLKLEHTSLTMASSCWHGALFGMLAKGSNLKGPWHIVLCVDLTTAKCCLLVL